ncbi:substrate-binding domain-containing protein [Sorangium sp. So ce1151]|uniref:substrate-binding domain-containing protein n=1 Tax=Sorangium sp. So ce1151 TaxID=3133332 RepID=UPI003F60552C
MTRMGRRWMTAFGLALMTAACGASQEVDEEEEVAHITRAPTPASEFIPVELEATVDNLVARINENELQPMQMVVLLKNLGAFFTPIATGASRAMGELGVTGNVLGPTDQSADSISTQDLQNQQMAEATENGAKGIGVSPLNDVNAAAIDEASARGVHVVTFDTDLASSKRSIYVGMLNWSAGATAGQTLLKMLPPPPGTVMIHGNVSADWVDGYERTQGAQQVLAEAGYTPVVSQVYFFGGGDAEDVAWMKSQMEAADPPVVGMLGLFNLSYRCAMAAEAVGKPELPVVAFDFDPKTVDYMRQGRIKATLIQRQYYEGYLVPYILYGINTIGLDATKAILAPQMSDEFRFNIGVDVVPGDKVDAYNGFLDSIGATQ